MAHVDVWCGLFLFLFFFFNVYFERERKSESECGGGIEREVKRESQENSTLSRQRPTWNLMS